MALSRRNFGVLLVQLGLERWQLIGAYTKPNHLPATTTRWFFADAIDDVPTSVHNRSDGGHLSTTRMRQILNPKFGQNRHGTQNLKLL
jgi:hypothetical protein